ncbi:MAG TPA: hypothetical protein VLL52_11585 [Anaerolineae bacterium]|nr:hypothetical protein [Anaerolineae bacterium]
MSDKEMFQALHPDPNKNGTRVTKVMYDAYRAALLAVIPKDEDGVLFGELVERVVPELAPEIAANTSPGWWVTTVKLDLEARRLIERVPGKGKQRLRRV